VISLLLLIGAACTTDQQSTLKTLVATTPQPAATDEAATATPASSSIILPTSASGPLATLTAIAGFIPTMDTNSPPYVITLTGRPIFIEFHAWW
jgi:hypothetical protein